MAAAAPVRCVGQYEIRETLGKGGYSWVKKGVDSKTGQEVALKFMARADKSWEKEQAEQVKTEIKSMIRINSKHVMKLYAYNLNCKYPEKDGVKTVNTILLVLEFCPGGELFDILYYTQQLDETTARTYFRQMIDGLDDCHKAGIVHRDIKPQNLLMDANYQLKITDFGLSFLSDPTQEAVMKTHYVGTRGYQAPELLRKKKYNKKCDIFSAGVVLFILLTGYPPFEQASKTDKWYLPLVQKNASLFWKQHHGSGVPSKCQDMLSGMLAYKPQNRSTIEEIRKHAWYTGPVHSPDDLKKVLQARHKESVARRKKDKKKMSEMQNSIKKRASDSMDETRVALLKHVDKLAVNKNVGGGASTLSWSFGRTTYYICIPKVDAKKKDDDAKKIPDQLVKAYDISTHALGFKGQAKITECTEGNPWRVDSTVKTADGHTFQTRMTVEKHEPSGHYYFGFTRIAGNVLKYHKLWESIENYLMAAEELVDEFELEDLLSKAKKAPAAVPENKAVVANDDGLAQPIAA